MSRSGLQMNIKHEKKAIFPIENLFQVITSARRQKIFYHTWLEQRHIKTLKEIEDE